VGECHWAEGTRNHGFAGNGALLRCTDDASSRAHCAASVEPVHSLPARLLGQFDRQLRCIADQATIDEHEYNELVDDEYSSKGHYDLLVTQGALIGLTGD
jgi:hypothetical protein